jgi:hypothetical protein
MVEHNKLKEMVDMFIPRTTEHASITLTMTVEKAKQLFPLLHRVLAETDRLPFNDPAASSQENYCSYRIGSYCWNYNNA